MARPRRAASRAFGLDGLRHQPAISWPPFDTADAHERGVLAATMRIVCMLLPFVSIPYWAGMYARATKKLGDRAEAFYAQPLPAVPIGRAIELAKSQSR
jgi:hypothetical protein